MKVLGIWDGHDSGAAIIEDNRILFAMNEERLTRRKLEIIFPAGSIEACLKNSNTSCAEIIEIAVSTSDFAKTLTRIFPSLKEAYYMIRRRKAEPASSSKIKKHLKYKLTEIPPSKITNFISRCYLRNRLQKIGFKNFNLHLIDHHHCHAVSAFCSGFDRSTVITLDGLGDGLSGSVYRFERGELYRVSAIPASHSLGVFFEHVTNLMNMRELEDEGKVMALANYAYPVDDNNNPMIDLMQIKNLSVRCRYSSLAMYDALKKIFWKYPSEQFAFMAQRTLEIKILELVKNAVNKTGIDNLCLAGGVFSNVKVNRLIRNLPEVNRCYVFPHMGDGGLPIGAAFALNNRLNGVSQISLEDVFLGPRYSDNEVEQALVHCGISYKKSENIINEVAQIITSGEIVFWFQGRMEIGPRSLGARSIIARPDSLEIKDRLNLQLKKRVWYQPFCPSMLEEDAKEILIDYDGNPNEFMTMAYQVRKSKRNLVQGVINIDGSCRPQILKRKSILLSYLLEEIKKLTGTGILLNTSFNIHGEPLVCSPEDAIKTFLLTGNRYMAINNYLVTQ